MEMVRYLMKIPEVIVPAAMLKLPTASGSRDDPLDVDVLEIGFECQKLKGNQKVRNKNLLSIAIEASKESFFNLLLEDPNVDVNYGFPSPLLTAINCDKPEMFLRLLSHPAIQVTSGYSGPVNSAVKSPNPFFLDHLTKVLKADFLKAGGASAPPRCDQGSRKRSQVQRRLLYR
jgi:hypothetical protein